MQVVFSFLASIPYLNILLSFCTIVSWVWQSKLLIKSIGFETESHWISLIYFHMEQAGNTCITVRNKYTNVDKSLSIVPLIGNTPCVMVFLSTIMRNLICVFKLLMCVHLNSKKYSEII